MSKEDLVWMIDDVGEKITYRHDSTETTFAALVDRNGMRPPEAGYEKALSQLHHEFTFRHDAIPNFTPKRGNEIILGKATYQVSYVFPDDSDVWVVAAR